jgi:dihydropteroate synthase
MELHLGDRVMVFDRCRIMGVLNTTPDSFSDGGKFLSPSTALRHAEAMAAQGADIIDVGGESTRPGAESISIQEEIDRAVPVVEQVSRRLDVAVSIDTSKPEVMRAAVGAGAVLINDVYALRKEGAVAAASELNAAVCLMHMQGAPQNMQDNPQYQALPGDILSFIETRIKCCVTAGIPANRLVIDPGFGFGKSVRHNLEILAGLEQFSRFGLPILVGLSRKGTLGNLTGRAAGERVAAGIAAAVLAAERGANIIRTHDVAETRDALLIAQAVREAGTES